MGWAVGWDPVHRRHRGYGVPAYCDARGCKAEIDRGLGFVAQQRQGVMSDEEYEDHLEEFDDLADGALFTCGDHDRDDVDENDLPAEHPTWVTHILTDDTWQRWRDENPDEVTRLNAARDGGDHG